VLLYSVALCIMVHHAIVSFFVLWPCLFMVLLQGGGQKTINLCGVGHRGGVIVAVMMALLVIVFIAEVVVFV